MFYLRCCFYIFALTNKICIMTKKQKLTLLILSIVILIAILFINSHKTNQESVSNNKKNQSSTIVCSNLALENIFESHSLKKPN